MLANKDYCGDRWEDHCSNLLNPLYELYCVPISDGL